tara:strand:+ start:104 stop:502 length:399 start_codon:yes stop_codon:yes gene_type:complete
MSHVSKTTKKDHLGVVRSANEAPKEIIRQGSATQRELLISAKDGASNFSMRRFTMGVNGGIPMHTNTVEHQQYVLRGKARVGVGEDVYTVKADDVLYIPAGTPHFYEVLEAPFEFLCVVPNAPDKIRILDRS